VTLAHIIITAATLALTIYNLRAVIVAARKHWSN
jgi:hypothetical protein